MKTYKRYDVKIPEYALSYLINGDDSGLNTEDIQAIDSYMMTFENESESVNGSIVICSPEENQESYFIASPAFGLACTVQDIHILILI